MRKTKSILFYLIMFLILVTGCENNKVNSNISNDSNNNLNNSQLNIEDNVENNKNTNNLNNDVNGINKENNTNENISNNENANLNSNELNLDFELEIPDVVEPAPVQLESWTCPEGWISVESNDVKDKNDNIFSWCEPVPLPRLKVGDYITKLEEGEEEGDRPICDPEADGNYPVLGKVDCQPLGNACPQADWPELPENLTGSKIYVLATGGEEADGSKDNPFKTLPMAIEAADDGDIIVVGPGEYIEPIIINKSITLWGTCVQKSIINEPEPDRGFENGTIEIKSDVDVKVKNIRISGSQNGVFIDSENLNLVLDGVWIHKTTRYGVLVKRGKIKIYNSLIDSVQTEEDFTRGRGLGAWVGYYELIINNSTIENTRDIGLIALHNHNGYEEELGGYVELNNFAVRKVDYEVKEEKSGVGLFLHEHIELNINNVLIDNASSAGVRLNNKTFGNINNIIIQNTNYQEFNHELGIGIGIENGTRVNFNQILIRNVYSTGFAINGSETDISLNNFVIYNIKARDSDLTMGYGIELTDNARVNLDKGLVSEARSVAVFLNQNSFSEINNIIIKNTSHEQNSKQGGYALAIANESKANIKRGVFDNNEDLSILITMKDTELNMEDVIIKNTKPNNESLENGAGIFADTGAICTIKRGILDNNYTSGVQIFSKGTVFKLEDVIIKNTKPMESTKEAGVGIAVGEGAKLDFNNGVIDSNHLAGVIVFNKNSEINIEKTIIKNNKSEEKTLMGGMGLYADTEAIANLNQVFVQNNKDGGIVIDGENTKVNLKKVKIENIKAADCFSLSEEDELYCENGDKVAGIGISNKATTTVEQVKISNSDFVGLALVNEGLLSGSKLEINDNKVGINLYNVSEDYNLQDSVLELLLKNNETDFDYLEHWPEFSEVSEENNSNNNNETNNTSSSNNENNENNTNANNNQGNENNSNPNNNSIPE